MKDKIFNAIQNIVLVVSFILCIFVVGQKLFFKDSNIFGYRLFVIVTGSMSPELDIGDVILVKDIDPNKIEKDDLITYYGMEGNYKDKVVTHKVTNITTENNRLIFYTKGLKNVAVDPAIYEEQIYGKVTYKFIVISLLSKIIRNKIGFCLLILIPLIAIFIKESMNLKKQIKEDKKKSQEKALEELSIKELKALKKEVEIKEAEKKEKEVKPVVKKTTKKSEKKLEKIEDKEFKKIIESEQKVVKNTPKKKTTTTKQPVKKKTTTKKSSPKK